jgi:hypothetical protein
MSMAELERARIKAQYRITEDDYVKAMRLHTWRDAIARPSATQLAVRFAIVILLGFAVWIEPIVGLVAILVFAIAVAVFLLFWLPAVTRKQYKQHTAIHDPLTVELLDDGIKFSSADGETKALWPKVFQWRQNDQFVLVYRMSLMFHIVPKSLAGEGFDIPLLVRHLAEHVGAER